MAPSSKALTHVIPPHDRDARVDFFRGLALLFIFVDHVKENALQSLTMQNFGFADAADVFVALAGYASFLAYTRVFDGQGWGAGLAKVGRRIGQLYLAHIVFLIACVGALVLAALLLDNPIYQDVVNLEPFLDEPMKALREALLLVHQPDMLDILPLYVVLLLWFPVLLLLMRLHVAIALTVSAGLWLAANLLGWNLPSYPENDGWFFNPFAWQLLFALGAAAAHLARREALPPTSIWLIVPAIGLVLFALAFAAPWTALPDWDDARLIPTETLLGPESKQHLSLWRVANLIALAYLASALIPVRAAWLANPIAQRIVDCGRNSLPVFVLGTALAMAANLLMAQNGDGWPVQIGINAVGLALLIVAGWALAWLAHARNQARLSGSGPRLSASARAAG
jgi:hypothetical protein